jgi:DNA repair exonuclease SbcCD ATPase subunit
MKLRIDVSFPSGKTESFDEEKLNFSGIIARLREINTKLEENEQDLGTMQGTLGIHKDLLHKLSDAVFGGDDKGSLRFRLETLEKAINAFCEGDPVPEMQERIQQAIREVDTATKRLTDAETKIFNLETSLQKAHIAIDRLTEE